MIPCILCDSVKEIINLSRLEKEVNEIRDVAFNDKIYSPISCWNLSAVLQATTCS